MECDKYIELMSAALDGRCTAEERNELDSHLAVCPDCAQLFELLSRNTQATRELDCEVPAGLKDRIMSALPAQEKPVREKKVINWKRWAPVAAAACVVLVVALVPMTGRGGSSGAAANSSSTTGSSSTNSALSPAASYGLADSQNAGTESVVSGSTTVHSEESDPTSDAPFEIGMDPEHYALENPQVIRVHYGATPESGAQIIGSVESLHEYLAGFESLVWDGEGNTVPIAELEALAETYTTDFFESHRLLCVVVESGSGSIRYELDPQGLCRDCVTVVEHVPEIGTCDMAAWLLTAEVDTMFDDGDILTVVFTD